MATESPPPPPPPPEDDKHPKQGVTQPATGIQHVQAEAPNKISPTSVFVNSEPMREDQVQNAVNFLSHPKVKGSPVMYRRSFLEKKGLTREEIDEAFRRVPDPPSGVQTTSVNQANGQTAVQQQNPQPVAAPPNAITPVASISRYRFHWSHAVYAVGLLAASGAGSALLLKKTIIPRLKSWIRKVVLDEEDNLEDKKIDSKPSLAEEAAAAAKAAAAAATDAAQATKEMMKSKQEERQFYVELTSVLNAQVREIKSMSSAVRKLEGDTNALRRDSQYGLEDQLLNQMNTKSYQANGKADYDSRSVRSASPPAKNELTMAPHPKSFMDIMAMIQRGEKPSNVREIDDAPPNPNQQFSNPRLAPKAKPWDINQAQNYSSSVIQSQTRNENFYSNGQDNRRNYSASGDDLAIPETQFRYEPKASAQINEQPLQNEPKALKRTWVPPVAPPLAMPEAAEAIRRPKASARESEDLDRNIADGGSLSEESRSSGVVEVNSENSVLSSSEIQEVKDEIYG